SSPALPDYEQLKGYLHSQTLRWSFGSMRGRHGDLAHRALAWRPLGEMVQSLALAGYSGISIDRAGYADSGAALRSSLTSLLSRPRLGGRGGTRSFSGWVDNARTLGQACPGADGKEPVR